MARFTFTAPWGEPMVARPGDAIVRDPQNPADTYRIAAAAFECTYEILEPALLTRSGSRSGAPSLAGQIRTAPVVAGGSCRARHQPPICQPLASGASRSHTTAR